MEDHHEKLKAALEAHEAAQRKVSKLLVDGTLDELDAAQKASKKAWAKVKDARKAIWTNNN